MKFQRIGLCVLMAAVLTAGASGCGGKYKGGAKKGEFKRAEDTFPVYEDRLIVEDIEPGVPCDDLVYDQMSDPKSFNWLISNETSSTDAQRITGADLLSLNRKTFEPYLNLAKSVEVSPDSREMIVHLRRVKWSDGVDFTADDVVFTFDAVFDKNLSSPQADLLTMDGEPIRVEKVDDHTVKFLFPKTNPAPLRVPDQIFILPKHKLEGYLKAGTLAEQWTVAMDPKEFVTLGAYMLKSYTPNVEVVLTRNPYYWKFDKNGVRLPYLETVTLKVSKDQDTMLLRFRDGQNHLLESVRGQDYAELTRMAPERGFIVQDLGPGLGDNFIFFNQNTGVNHNYQEKTYRTYPHLPGKVYDNEGDLVEDAQLVKAVMATSGKPIVDPVKSVWFRDRNFRRAVAMAMDRKTMADTIFFGLAQPLYSNVTPALAKMHNPDTEHFPYDLALAKKLLNDSGYVDRNGDGFLEDPNGNKIEFNMLTNAGNDQRHKMGTIAADDLLKIGIKVNFNPIDFNKLIESMNATYDYDAVLMGLTGTYDPTEGGNVYKSNGFTHVWFPRQPAPATEWEKRIDDLYITIDTDTNQDNRIAAWKEVQKIVAEEGALVHLVCVNAIVGGRANLGNFESPYGPGLLNPRVLMQAEYYFWKPEAGN